MRRRSHSTGCSPRLRRVPRLLPVVSSSRKAGFAAAWTILPRPLLSVSLEPQALIANRRLGVARLDAVANVCRGLCGFVVALHQFPLAGLPARSVHHWWRGTACQCCDGGKDENFVHGRMVGPAPPVRNIQKSHRRIPANSQPAQRERASSPKPQGDHGRGERSAQPARVNPMGGLIGENYVEVVLSALSVEHPGP
jgi:hypothetical protein